MSFIKKLSSALLLANALITGMDVPPFMPLPLSPILPRVDSFSFSELQSDLPMTPVPDFFASEYWQGQAPLPIQEQSVLPSEGDISLPLSHRPIENKEIKKVDRAQRYVCSEVGCSMLFDNTLDCENHMIKNHIVANTTTLKSFLCKVCGRRFALKSESIAHVQHRHLITDSQVAASKIHTDSGMLSSVKNLVIRSLQNSLHTHETITVYGPVISEQKKIKSPSILQRPYAPKQEYVCSHCGKEYRKYTWFKKHQASHGNSQV